MAQEAQKQGTGAPMVFISFMQALLPGIEHALLEFGEVVRASGGFKSVKNTSV